MRLRIPILPVALAVCTCGTVNAAPAEYAIRWTVTAKVPKTIAEVMKVLKLKPKAAPESFEVRYYEVAKSPDAPDNAKATLRQRSTDGQPEVTWKYRSDRRLPTPATWSCPLQGPSKSKFEADITFMSIGTLKSFSWSCTGSGTVDVLLPRTLKHNPLGCSSHMVRSETTGKGYRVEEWDVKKGATIFEVSWTATDADKDKLRFVNDVAVPLLRYIQPLDRSKTEIVSSC